MKLATSKYWRLYKSIVKCESDIIRLEKVNAFRYRYKIEGLEKSRKEKQIRLDRLALDVEQSEFELYLESNMCCSWQDFTESARF